MTEYLKKKAVLEYTKQNAAIFFDLESYHDFRNAVLSGAFDADDLIGDRIDEKCPKCGADMLANKVGDKWCSLVGCDYSINAPEGDGNDAN